MSTHKQLEHSIAAQRITGNKMDDESIEDGYAASHHVKHGVRLRQRLVIAALAIILAFFELLLSGCGGGGGDAGATSSVTTYYGSDQVTNTAYLTVTSDNYNLVKPTFYYSTVNESFWSIQANIASYIQDINTRCVIRVDVPKINGNWPLLNKKFSIEDNPNYETFPGKILVFNGNPTTMSKVEHGIISFTSDSITSEHVSGFFEVTMTNYDSGILPLPQHHLRGDFNFKMGEYRQAEAL
jgi:hypothetical protein